jgi:hypothetical protein
MGIDIEVDMIMLISAYSIVMGAPTIKMQSTLVNIVRLKEHPSLHKIANMTNFHINVVLRHIRIEPLCGSMKLRKQLVSLLHGDNSRTREMKYIPHHERLGWRFSGCRPPYEHRHQNCSQYVPRSPTRMMCALTRHG